MGFFAWLRRLLGFESLAPPAADTIQDVADRLDRTADRFSNSTDVEGERAARDAASRARRAPTLKQALEIEREFQTARNLLQRKDKPRFSRGVGPAGQRYVSIGGVSRVGGSRAWRNNNPGYIRCSNRAIYYGAIGCDGEFAIFPDWYIGRAAMYRWLHDEYPDDTLRDALQQQLPPEAGPDAAQRIYDDCGLPPDTTVRDLN